MLIIKFRMKGGTHVQVELNNVGRLVANQKLCKCMKGILFYLNAADDLVASSYASVNTWLEKWKQRASILI